MLRKIRVLARLAVRWVVRYLTGRRWTALMPDERKIMQARVAEFVRAITAFWPTRRVNNRDLLTGMVVALRTGVVPAMTGWEMYKYAARRRSNRRPGLATRWVGKPVVYAGKNTKVGMTEWSQDYTPRSEVLAARKRLRGA